MLRLLHLSDLHFGPRYLPQVGEALLRIVTSFDLDAAIISGDMTQRAKRRQFADAKAFLNRLPDVPKVVVPGNHDVPLYRVAERIAAPHALYREYICDELNHHVSIAGALIVALDTTAPHTAITNGRVSRSHLQYCEDVFAEAPDGAARIVVAHHPFISAPDQERDKTVRGAKGALHRLGELEVDMVLGGHLHRSYISSSCDAWPETTPSDRGVLVIHCGTSTSSRGRAGERGQNTFNLITLNETSTQVSNYLYRQASDQFEPIGNQVFPRK